MQKVAPKEGRRRLRCHTDNHTSCPLLLLHVTVATLLLTSQRVDAFVAPKDPFLAQHAGVSRSKYIYTTRSYVDTSAAPLLRTLPTFTTTSSSLSATEGFDLEQILFNVESVAASLASVSLKDPTSVWTSLPVMYGAGLLTSISPCLWGLLPLTMSYISTAAGERPDKQATIPTLAFAGGLASVFCTLGVIAATVGGVFGTTSNATGGTAIGAFAVAALSSGVCLAMGLQLLNLVELPLPSFDLKTLTLPFESKQKSAEPILIDFTGAVLQTEEEKDVSQAGSIFRTFLLGGSSALVASPCATPVLTSILAFVAQAHNPSLGALYLFFYTIGYSTPLLVVAATGGQALANMKGEAGGDSPYAKIAPWVSPITAGILLWYGTNGLLVALFGDPSLAALAPILE